MNILINKKKSILILLILISTILYLFLNKDKDIQQKDIPVLEFKLGKYKYIPKNKEGIIIENQDKYIYNTIASEENKINNKYHAIENNNDNYLTRKKIFKVLVSYNSKDNKRNEFINKAIESTSEDSNFKEWLSDIQKEINNDLEEDFLFNDNVIPENRKEKKPIKPYKENKTYNKESNTNKTYSKENDKNKIFNKEEFINKKIDSKKRKDYIYDEVIKNDNLYVVNMGSYSTRKQASNLIKYFKSIFDNINSSVKYKITEIVNVRLGIYYKVEAFNIKNRKKAKELCSFFKNYNGTCFVLKKVKLKR